MHLAVMPTRVSSREHEQSVTTQHSIASTTQSRAETKAEQKTSAGCAYSSATLWPKFPDNWKELQVTNGDIYSRAWTKHAIDKSDIPLDIHATLCDVVFASTSISITGPPLEPYLFRRPARDG